MEDNETFSGDKKAILWTTVDPDAPDDGLGWGSRAGIVHSYASYREVGQPDWSAATETGWLNGPVGFWGLWSWIHPTRYIGVSGFYEIKMGFEDADGNITEEVYTIEVVIY